MLVLVTLFVVIFETVFDLKSEALKFNFNVQEVDDAIAWINAQKSWATLFLQSLYILPTWLVFRFAPGYPRHTLPEGFFLQVFLSVLNLFLVFVGYWSHNVELTVWTIYLYITYHQLFGYGWWSTLWRLAVVVLTQWAVIVVAVTIVIFFYGYDDESQTDPELIKAIVFILAVTAVLTAVMLLVTHLINKRNDKETKIYSQINNSQNEQL